MSKDLFLKVDLWKKPLGNGDFKKYIKGDKLDVDESHVGWLLKYNIAGYEQDLHVVTQDAVKEAPKVQKEPTVKKNVVLPPKSASTEKWRKAAEDLGINTKNLKKRAELIAACQKAL